MVPFLSGCLWQLLKREKLRLFAIINKNLTFFSKNLALLNNTYFFIPMTFEKSLITYSEILIVITYLLTIS